MRRKPAPLLLALAALVLAAGGLLYLRREDRAAQAEAHEKQLFAMDTVMSFTAYGPNGEVAVDAAMQEVQRLDALLSTGNPASEISRINTEGRAVVTEDTWRLLNAAREIREETNGLFDCTIYPLMTRWGFPTGDYRVPDEDELNRYRLLVDGSRVALEENRTVTLGSGQQIDLGGIAKGYTSARLMELFRENGVRSGLVSLGGNVQVLGAKPDGSPWRIGVRDPSGGTYVGVLSLEDRAVITSGGYERYFEQDGKTYIHILDPRTGRPAESDLLSVTVVSRDGTKADALSTALFIMGREEAADFWRARSGEFDLVLVDTGGGISVTEGISACFQTDGNFTVIEKGET